MLVSTHKNKVEHFVNGLRAPTLIPKPEDWGSHISIAGFFFLPTASTYVPPPRLATFLENGQQPIDVGFGSIVVEDSKALTSTIVKAVRMAGVRAIISQGWSDLGTETKETASDIHFVGDCPHDWILTRVSCVVHHGGAGTTAAAIQAGRPSVIIPFFGDQPFWRQMVEKAGAGPHPIPYKELTVTRLAAAIKQALGATLLQSAQLLSEKIRRENGVKAGVYAFHRQLLGSPLICSISPGLVANWKVRKAEIRLSTTALATLMDQGRLDLKKVEL